MISRPLTLSRPQRHKKIAFQTGRLMLHDILILLTILQKVAHHLLFRYTEIKSRASTIGTQAYPALTVPPLRRLILVVVQHILINISGLLFIAP